MPGDRAVGLRLIIVYKAVKAVVQAALAVALLYLRRPTVTARLAAFATDLSEHLEHSWTAALARRIAALLTPNHLALVSVALGLDAAVSALEGWALHRRFRWAPWLVVVAGASLIPFEIVELLRAVRPGRALALIINVAIVGYLLARARKETRHHHQRQRRPPA